ncbi:MAG: type II toxin-antitoxin system Phd/YefM family antitoxin [Candidatus Competibacter sp.]|nr:type II toxin-antitoxin system Phd/YefM family antitoxin [Candidatus Competibacter sp.]
MMHDMKVSSAEFIKNYGQLADKALTEPVTITRNGHDRLVLLSVDEYNRLKRRDRQVYRAGDVPDDVLTALEATEAPAESEAAERELARKSR